MNDKDLIIQNLTQQLSDMTEALAASTEARRMMADTISDLRLENSRLRVAALNRAVMRPPHCTLTDRGLGDGYVADDYDTSHWGVR